MADIIADRRYRPVAHFAAVRRFVDFQQYPDLGHLVPPGHLDAKLINGWMAPHDVLDNAGKHVDPAHDEHVVGAPQNAAVGAYERAAAATRRGVEPHQVARAITDRG